MRGALLGPESQRFLRSPGAQRLRRPVHSFLFPVSSRGRNQPAHNPAAAGGGPGTLPQCRALTARAAAEGLRVRRARLRAGLCCCWEPRRGHAGRQWSQDGAEQSGACPRRSLRLSAVRQRRPPPGKGPRFPLGLARFSPRTPRWRLLAGAARLHARWRVWVYGLFTQPACDGF